MALKYLNEDAILATIDNSNNPMEGVRILVGGIKDLRAERDALAKRVEELESFLTAWVAIPDDDFEPAKALWREALRIAERRAGRAK